MADRVCLVHYHEIGLKGKNRSTFENQLVTNLRRALRDFAVSEVRRVSGHLLVRSEDGQATEELAHAIACVPGVARVSLAYCCALDQEEYCAAAVRALGEAGDFESFKVHARRSQTNQARGDAPSRCDGRRARGAERRLRVLRLRPGRGRAPRGHRGQGRHAPLERL